MTAVVGPGLRFAAVFAFALFSSPVALPAAARGPVECHVDVFWGVHVPGAHVGVTGWAVDHRPGAIPPRVTVAVGAALAVEIERGRPRPDVARHFGRPDLLLSSFHGAVRIPRSSAGDVSVEVAATSADGVSTSCGSRTIRIRPFAPQPVPDPIRNGTRTLLRAWLAVLALSLAGGALLPRRAPLPRYLFAPAVGLAVLGLASEAGRFAGLTPLASLLVATFLLLAFSVARSRAPRGRSRSPVAVTACLLLALGYSVAGVVPVARQGDGVVMGGITDALLECAHADGLLHPHRPADTPGYRAAIARNLDLRHNRPGQSYLLAAMAAAEGVSPEVVHSSAMLAGGVTLLLTVSALALALLPCALALAAVALLALNSVFYTALYTQHLANLLGLSLLLLFTAGVVALFLSPRPKTAGRVSLALAAGWTFYPEMMLVWAVFAGVALAVLVPSGRRIRALGALALAAAAAAALNPVGLVRAIRWTVTAQAVLRNAGDLHGFGDTHYIPPLPVFVGAEPYRLDAAAPLSAPRRNAAQAATAATAALVLVGFAASANRRRRLALVLLLPAALALGINRLIGFPYGFSRGIAGGVAFWTLTLSLLAVPLAYARSRWRGHGLRPAMASVGLLLLALGCLSVRHVIRLNSGLVPLFDPAFGELPALAAALPREAAVATGGWSGPELEWIRYMLGTLETKVPGLPAQSREQVSFRLVDLRTTDQAGPAAVSTPRFAAVGPLQDTEN